MGFDHRTGPVSGPETAPAAHAVPGRRTLTILGSTGTIGRLTVEVARRLPERFEVVALAARRNVALLSEQALSLRPQAVAIAERGSVDEFRERVGDRWKGEIFTGAGGIVEMAGACGEITVNGLVGAAGLAPSLAVLRGGRTLALANKESLVVAGELMRRVADETGGRILPIDSEHSGLQQCIEGRDTQQIRRVILTASGGPFRTRPQDQLETVKPEEALLHPTWRMGPRITIDSATLLNKGFEIHEAHWLFGLKADQIDVWIHPQSIVHALVEWADGSLLAQLSATDMRLPIQLALCYPARINGGLPRCDLTQIGRLDFEPVDPGRFPCLALARTALAMGGTAPATLNGADEVLVEAFLLGKVRFPEIAKLLARVLEEHRVLPVDDLEAVLEADRAARVRAQALAGLA